MTSLGTHSTNISSRQSKLENSQWQFVRTLCYQCRFAISSTFGKLPIFHRENAKLVGDGGFSMFCMGKRALMPFLRWANMDELLVGKCTKFRGQSFRQIQTTRVQPI